MIRVSRYCGKVHFAKDVAHCHPGKQDAIECGKRRQEQNRAQNVRFKVCNKRSKKKSYQSRQCVVCQTLIVVSELVYHCSNCTSKALRCIYRFHVEPFHCQFIPLPIRSSSLKSLEYVVCIVSICYLQVSRNLQRYPQWRAGRAISSVICTKHGRLT